MTKPVLLALLLAGAPVTPVQADDAQRYADCMAIVRQQPQGALDLATGWRADGGAVPAMHCQALALIELGQPARAAAVLDAARETMQTSTVERAGPLAAMLAAQAGNAWMLANDPARARDRMTAALALYDAQSPYRIEALIDRARAHAALEGWAEAIRDLNEALALDATRADALLFRATARRLSQDLAGAEADITKAATLSPQDADILFERGVIRQGLGRIADARADWTQAAKATGTEAAKRAAAALAGVPPR